MNATIQQERNYWDCINEADNEPNLSKSTFGPEACAIGGTGMEILSTVVAVNRGWIGKLFMNNPDIQNGLKKLGFKSKWVKQ